jgi:hypothetical protein
MTIMAEQDVALFREEYFVDSRGPVRRMRVRWHPENRLIVLSLWQAGHCTGTFRLPVEDSARLIGVLADGLAGACGSASQPTVTPLRKHSLIAAVRRWLRRRPPGPPSFTVISGG